MLNVKITTITHSEQRYPTVGDYYFVKDANNSREDYLQIKVSELGNWKKELLVALHELVEWALTEDRQIPEGLITAFDTEFERRRIDGDVTEPGDAAGCPYRKEHFFATNIERLTAEQLHINWQEYEAEIEAL